MVLPFGKYEYLKLPMGLINSPDIFQEKISELFYGFEHVRAYIDDILLTTKKDWSDHLLHLEQVLQKLAEAGLKVNADKSFFGRHECEYLGYWVTRTGIRPLVKKVQAITNIKAPTTQKQVRSFVGLVNYYRDMWPRRSHMLAPLTKRTATNVKFKWSDTEQKAFEDIKREVAREVLLSYPNFNEEFAIHADASKTQLGGIISQKGKPVAFYSRKLNDAQTRYTTTERELLSIVETLKEFRTILLGQRIKIYTDHKNLTCKGINTDRVIRWRLLLEEYGPEIIYLKGESNGAADAMSRLPIEEYHDIKALKALCSLPTTNFTIQESDVSESYLAETYGVDKLEAGTFPLTYKILNKYQRKGEQLLSKLKRAVEKSSTDHTEYTTKSFRGGGTVTDLICRYDRIVVPKQLQKYVLEWYHTYLLHPGRDRTEETIKQHLYWPNMHVDICAHVSTCDTCQKTKKYNKKYGHLPEKAAEAVPWERLCVDLIGPYTIERVGQENLELKAVTMIDPATSCLK